MVEHFVPFDRPPAGLRVPPDLEGRFDYDAARKRLVFRGFMSKADFDRLAMLADDWSYRRAIDDLFQACTPEDEAGGTPARGLFRRLASAVGLA
jgi:hypothetical protein